MVYPIARWIVPPFIGMWINEVNRVDNIPRDKPFIIAANHSSFLDDFTLVSTVVERIGKKVHMYCNDRFYKNRLFAAFLRWAGCIPISIQTKNKETNRTAFDLALRYLRKGEPVGIFPEGGRSVDGELKKAKTGVAKLALVSEVPVLPIGIIGSYDVFPKGAIFPKFKRFDIKVGQLLHFDKYYKDGESKSTLENVTREIMNEIASLIDKEYRY